MSWDKVVRLYCDTPTNHGCHLTLSTIFGPFYQVEDARATARELGWFCRGLDLCPNCRDIR